jgi:hypothetical protein
MLPRRQAAVLRQRHRATDEVFRRQMKETQFTSEAPEPTPRLHFLQRNSRKIMNTLRKCASEWVWTLALAPLAALAALAALAMTVIFSAPLTADQNNPTPIEARLPAATQFYLHWRGTNSLNAATTKNRLLQLWADPDFAPVRQSITKQAFAAAWKATSSEPVRADQMGGFVALFENESVAGSMAPIEGKAAGAKTEEDSFVVYDATGKMDVVQRAVELMEKSAPGTPKVSSYSFGETKIESIETGAKTIYWAQAGNYFVRASRKETEEELVGRFRAKTPLAASLADDAEWERAKEHFLPGAAIDVYLRLGKPPAANGGEGGEFDRGKFERGTHLDRVHAFVASVDLSGEATRVRAVLSADTSEGSLFDIAGASAPEFETMLLARDGASYNVVRVNFPAIYQLFHGALLDSVSAKQANTLKGFDMMGAAYLGSPIPDVLAGFGGEMASISSTPDDSTYSNLYVMTIRKPDQVLSLLRKTLGSMIDGEDRSGETTFLDLSSKSVDPQTKAPRRQSYFVAVTPRMLLVSQRKEMVRDAAARVAGPNADLPATALQTNPEFQRVRALLPQNLSGMTYTQMSQQSWERSLSAMVESASKAGRAAPDRVSADALRSLNLSVFSRHLHWYAGGWWKAADGIYFDSYLQ